MHKLAWALSAGLSIIGSSAAIADDAADDLQGVAAPLLAPDQWDETATPLYYNGELRLGWHSIFGDHTAQPVGSIALTNQFAGSTVSAWVTGNDFYLACGAGSVTTFASREDPDPSKSPMLIVNGQARYTATRDTSLDPSTSSPLGASPTMNCRKTLLIAFDRYTPKPNDKAVLVLSVDRVRGAQTISIFHPTIVFTGVDIPSTPATTIVGDFRAKDFKPTPNLVVSGNIVTGSIEGAQRTAFNQVFKLPPAQEYYLTVVMQLDQQWPDWGGKLPGLADTGQATNSGDTPLKIVGVNCNNSGWGGRDATGCRWSARTGWLNRQGDQIGFATYYYAMNTGTLWGKSNPIPSPITAGKWFAYVQRVKMNSVGGNDGLLSYWFCSESGCTPTYHKNDIMWRSVDIAQSRITEAWANVYCGGLNCGPGPLARATSSIERMTVTDGLPAFGPIAAQLKNLNGR